MQEILNAQKNSRMRCSISSFLHKPKNKLLFKEGVSERVHSFFFVDIAPLNSNDFVKRIIAITNAGVYFLKPPTGEPCPIEGPS